MHYRREVDGLRAIAVIPVILFHAGFESFRGGFVGVDVFFVISGYLITTIILSELAQGRFSLLSFYERRARRIMPALFFVMAACIPFAWMWFLPSDMKDFSESIAAVATFVSNFLFWQQSGYFATVAEFKPLLHTWSLAVEEQYYVLFPLLLMLTWRRSNTYAVKILIVIAGLSLALAQWGTSLMPSANFFLLPSRIWELLVGALAAFYLLDPQRRPFSRSTKELGGALGLAMVLYAVFAYDQSTPFPSVYALVPTVGTALIILCVSTDTLVGRLLSLRIFVGIGLISYSAYLWHQPLFAFARYTSLTEPSPRFFGALSVTALVLAVFSWKFVESPFRNRKRFTRTQIFSLAAGMSLIFLAFGIAGSVTGGFADLRPRDHDMKAIEARLAPNYGLSSDCENAFNRSERCRTHDTPEMLLWGDSLAMHLAPGLVASSADPRLMQQTVSVCGPFLDIAPVNIAYPIPWAHDCMRFNDEVLELLKNTPSLKYVVMASAFMQYVGYDKFSVMKRDGELLTGVSIAKEAILNTLKTLTEMGKVPVLISPPPQNGNHIGQCLMNALRTHTPLPECDIRVLDSLAYRQRVYDLLIEIEKEYPVIWLDEQLCAGGSCRVHEGPLLLYRDFEHLTTEGSAHIGRGMNFYTLVKQQASRQGR